MLRITCPFCGTRDEEEFSYGGPWRKARPAEPAALSDAQWADYLFVQANPRGPSLEKWRHTHGCRQWFVVERHTVTHAVIRVTALSAIARTGEAAVPDAEAPGKAGA